MRISINPAQTSHGRRGPEGDRPSGSHEQHFLTEDHPAASIPTTHYRSRNFPPRHCLLPSKRSGGRPALRLQPLFSLQSFAFRLYSVHVPHGSRIFQTATVLIIANKIKTVSRETAAKYKRRYMVFSQLIKTFAHNENERRSVKIKEYFRNRHTPRLSFSDFNKR